MSSFALFIGWVTIVLGGAYFAAVLWAFFVNTIGHHISINRDLVQAAYHLRRERLRKRAQASTRENE